MKLYYDLFLILIDFVFKFANVGLHQVIKNVSSSILQLHKEGLKMKKDYLRGLDLK